MLSRTATLLMLLNAIVAVLIVNFASFLVTEDFVRFGYFDKLLVRCVITTGLC